MNAPVCHDPEVWFDLPAPKSSTAPACTALVIGIAVGVLVSAGLVLTLPTPQIQCAAYQIAEATP